MQVIVDRTQATRPMIEEMMMTDETGDTTAMPNVRDGVDSHTVRRLGLGAGALAMSVVVFFGGYAMGQSNGGTTTGTTQSGVPGYGQMGEGGTPPGGQSGEMGAPPDGTPPDSSSSSGSGT